MIDWATQLRLRAPATEALETVRKRSQGRTSACFCLGWDKMCGCAPPFRPLFSLFIWLVRQCHLRTPSERLLLSCRRIRHAPKEPRFIVGLFTLERLVGHEIRLASEAGDQPAPFVPTA